ncbi:type VI secretion system Vgr family protein [Aquabacterium sp. NJ1]|uniref:type VI secretion system Vgr family protein n=1 Tax=Aquabacterium sp. NJ1 TaxID=1538295 RepID=UPI0006909E36|nr:type VI secretion system Vgr family protein [Aquabacterium sp. NJ1]
MGLDSSFLKGGLDAALSATRSAVDSTLGGLLAQWGSDTRLYTLSAPSSERSLPADLMVESFVMHEAVSEPFSLYVNALVLHAQVELKQLYARPITLETTLADGGKARRSGYVVEASALEADGGFARKGLLIQPWMALLGHTLNSRVWQEKSVIEIVEDVFADHSSIAAWKWDDDVATYVAEGLFARNGGQRAYCVQYRETDLAFVQRLLAEEGICWRVEEDESAPGGHTVVFFVSSAQQPQDAISASSLGGAGIRFHGSSSQEVQDSIQALGSVRQIGPTGTVLQGWDYKAHAAITAEVPTAHEWGGDEATSLQSWLTSYDPTGDFVFGNQAEAQFAATRLQEAHEARYKTWLGRGTVRTLRAGTWFAVTQSTLDPLSAFGLADEDKQFFVTGCDVIGINNLPKELSDKIAKTLGAADLPALAATGPDTFAVDSTALYQRAAQTGYACQFQALRRNVPWRAVLMDDTGLRPRPRPTALGPQTAIVVGPDGNVNASGADELYTDQLGRIKVQFHWQANAFAPQRANSDHSCWLRVMQRLTGPGMGHQFIPRIGQEVLVGFLGNDIDRPFVMASLYNGRGESGVPRTPGGQPAEADTAALAESTDHSPSSQMNLVGSGSGGNSPAWHGAAPGAATEDSEGQANAAALSGVKSKEFGGSGYNQLVFDDTPGQLRAQLHSTQSQTWLQMGHLLHQADNHRGSFRGLGFELRTDAWGGLRAARGVMLSTFGLGNGLGQTGTPAGDNAPGMALAKQAQQLASTFHQAASTHQTVGLATTAGSVGGNKSNLDDRAAPAAALTKSLSGMVSTSSLPNAQADAAAKATGTGQSKVPHMADPNIALVGKAGIGLTAGQDLHLSAQDTTQIASGQDTHFAVGGQARVHTGQAIGVLAGAIQPGAEAAGKGLTMIAAQGPIEMQAQAGPAQIAAKQELQLKTASGVVNIAAAKKVTLAVSGGASITIEGGSFTAQCPGKITVQAGQKSMVGPQILNQDMPGFPTSTLTTPLTLTFDSAPFGQMSGWAGMPYKVFANGAMIKQDVLDASGSIELKHAPAIERYKVVLANGMTYDIPVVERYRNTAEGPLAAMGVFKGEDKQSSSASRSEYQSALNALVNSSPSEQSAQS